MTGGANVYTDMHGLSGLKEMASRHDPQALREVAKQFEAVFLQMMLKSMRDAAPGDPLFEGGQGDLYRDLFDKQLSIMMAQRGGFGIATAIERQLGGSAASPDDGIPAAKASSLSAPSVTNHVFVDRSASPPSSSATETGSVQETSSPSQTAETGGHDEEVADVTHNAAVESSQSNVTFDTPAEFIAGMWPHAQRAAKRLGVEPKMLIAQAALESGWGKSVPRRADGRNTHNLFGIKADARWSGESARVWTLEYEGGAAVRKNEPFRVYSSYAESFDDYAGFLSGNPRYREALARADNAGAYARGLQKAGYATDPAYAAKILRIVDGVAPPPPG